MLNGVWWNNETPSAPNRWWNSGSFSSLCHIWTMPFSHFTRNKSAAEFSDVVQVWSPKQRRFVQLGRRTWKDNHESRGTLFQCWHTDCSTFLSHCCSVCFIRWTSSLTICSTVQLFWSFLSHHPVLLTDEGYPIVGQLLMMKLLFLNPWSLRALVA